MSYEERLNDADEVINELLDLISFISTRMNINDIFQILLSLKDDTYWKEDIENTIYVLATYFKICPHCGNDMTHKNYFEKHYELDDGNNLEEFIYLQCEGCGYNTLDE